MLIRRLLAGLAPTLLVSGCAAAPIAVVPHVDLDRFMGDWYVIANIPTFIEKDAYNAVESYRLDSDGTVATTFTFRAGGFDGEAKRYTPRGFVRPGTNNAVWGMQFVWPVKADYRILYLADDYSLTLVGREKRDYLWVMARTPSIPAERLESVLKIAAAQGYDVSRVRKVPQRWN